MITQDFTLCVHWPKHKEADHASTCYHLPISARTVDDKHRTAVCWRGGDCSSIGVEPGGRTLLLISSQEQTISQPSEACQTNYLLSLQESINRRLREPNLAPTVSVSCVAALLPCRSWHLLYLYVNQLRVIWTALDRPCRYTVLECHFKTQSAEKLR